MLIRAGRSSTAILGEHMIAVLVVAIVAASALAAYPPLKARVDAIVTRAEARANLPLTEANALDNGTLAGVKRLSANCTGSSALAGSSPQLRLEQSGRADCEPRDKIASAKTDDAPIECVSCP
ncbi:MAG: hypothetical protein A2Y55_07860 [Actinobacteria bacterium RBG_16_68_12]|nr:MAG: hypothetical protein A2Y55_07860 [Actinobacteria bacterium RBG_16_68_12]